MGYYMENGSIRRTDGTVVDDPAILFDTASRKIYGHGDARDVRDTYSRMVRGATMAGDPCLTDNLNLLELSELQLTREHECYLLKRATEYPSGEFIGGLADVLFFNMDPVKWLDENARLCPIDVAAGKDPSGSLKILMAAEFVRPGPEFDEWCPVESVIRSVDPGTVDAVRTSLDDCVASMVVATLPVDYSDPISDVLSWCADGHASLVTSGFAYGRDFDALCAAVGETADTLFGDPAREECGDRNRARIVAAVFREN